MFAFWFIKNLCHFHRVPNETQKTLPSKHTPPIFINLLVRERKRLLHRVPSQFDKVTSQTENLCLLEYPPISIK